MPESIEVGAKLVAYLAVIMAIGCAGVSELVRHRADAAMVRSNAWTLFAPAAAALAVATLVRAWAHTAAAFGVADSWTWENLCLIALESRWGEGWRLQALSTAMLAVAAVAVHVRRGAMGRPEPPVRFFASLAALAAAFAIPQTGHAAAEPYRWLLHGTHVAAAGLWAGTLVVMVSLRGQARPLRPQLLHAFARLAAPAVAVVALSGVWASSLYLGRLGNLVASEYGRLLLAKGSLVAVMAMLGGVNWLRLRRDAAGEVPLTVYLEAGLAVAVVVLTAWLTETAHP